MIGNLTSRTIRLHFSQGGTLGLQLQWANGPSSGHGWPGVLSKDESPCRDHCRHDGKRNLPPCNPPDTKLTPLPFWVTQLGELLRAWCWSWEEEGGGWQAPDEGRLPGLRFTENISILNVAEELLITNSGKCPILNWSYNMYICLLRFTQRIKTKTVFETLKDSLQIYGPSFQFSFSLSFHVRFYMANWNYSVTHLNLTSIENAKEN